MAERETEMPRLERMRDRLERDARARIPDAVVHGRGAPRAPHILNISVPGTDSESMLMALDLRGIACSAGSACQSGSIDAVARARGDRRRRASSRSPPMRMSLGSLTTDACIERVVQLFPALIAKARRLSRRRELT